MTELKTKSNGYYVHLHHVGGFGGTPFHVPHSLRGDVNLYLYDANADALDSINEDTDFRKQLVIGKAVSDRNGEIDVHLTYHPAASSLHFWSKEYLHVWKDGYQKSDMCDILQPEFRHIKTVRVPCTTVDAICSGDDVGVDFLSLDAEGSEGSILLGAQHMLEVSIVGVISEITFATSRVDQVQAGDLFNRLEALQFHLTDLQMHEGMSFKRLPLGWRDQGNRLTGDATFLKRMDAILAHHPIPALSLLKLGLFSLLTQRLEHCVAAIEAALAADDQILNRGSDITYVKMFTEMMDLYRSEKVILLPTWSDYYPTAEAALRHCDPDRGVDAEDACRRYFSRVNTSIFLERVSELATQEDSPLEKLLKRYEFYNVAAITQAQRFRGLSILLHWLRLVEKDVPTNLQILGQKISRIMSEQRQPQ